MVVNKKNLNFSAVNHSKIQRLNNDEILLVYCRIGRRHYCWSVLQYKAGSFHLNSAPFAGVETVSKMNLSI